MEMSDEETINYIIENFDFERVRGTMQLLDWRWSVNGSLTELEVPSVAKLVLSAQRYLTMAVEGARKNKSEYFTGSGGFYADAHYNATSDTVYAKLSFVLESFDNYD